MTSTFTGYNGPDAICGPLLNKLWETVQAYQKLENTLAAADGDREAALKNWMDTTDNAAAVKLRTTIENAVKKLRELAEGSVQDITLSDEEKAKTQAEMEALKPKIKAAFNVVGDLVQNMSDDPEGVKAALESIPNPIKSGRGRKPGSAGSSLPRVSATVTVNGGNLNNVEYDSFSKVASVLQVEVIDLQKAFADAAGVEHSEIKTVDKSVTFEFQPNSNGSVYTLTTKPKTRAPKGSKNAPEVQGTVDSEQPVQTEETQESAA